MPHRLARSVFAAGCITFAASLAFSADPLPTKDGTAKALKAIPTFRLPNGLKVELFAAEPKLNNPVAICLDERNRVYVAEEYRFNLGTEENRTRPFLLEDDLQIQTLDDRLAMYKKWQHKFEGGMDWFTKWSDQVRLLEDRDGDGRADFSSVFAGPFNGVLDGLAAGVIARDGDVYLTCIPNLWLLRDTDNDGKADVKKVLHRGFGVNAAFLGHDLHGLVWGPDGKLYFSVGDRGFHVKTHEGKTLHGPRNGAVFRCDPDGANLEVIFRGLRNPQEIAFDQYGNLFAADNNCDKGDLSRLVYIVDGGNSGWNMSYQTIPAPYLTGPWHAERMWHVPPADQPAWIVPPVGPLGAGPSGFAFSSGVGLPDRYSNYFFHCNFTGRGGVEAFGVKPKGAGFEIVDHHDFLKPIRATDVDFGYDGKVYVSYFGPLNWSGGPCGGRIYTVHDPQRIKSPIVADVKQLFANGFKQRGNDELAKLLAHRDMRVRLRAQFALAERGTAAIGTFKRITHTDDAEQLTRLHGIWGLGQIARKLPRAGALLPPLLKDSDAEVRAQAAKVIGDVRIAGAEARLVELLQDNSPRVRFFATMALGKLRHKPAVNPIFTMLKQNADKDVFLRHAGVTALEWIHDVDSAVARIKSRDRSVRMAVLLLLRRWQDPRIAQFLADTDIKLVTEAARAINDLPIDSATLELADLAGRLDEAAPPIPDALVRRTINANFRIGKANNVNTLLSLSTSSELSETVRREALAAVGDWAEPSNRDRVTGFWRPLKKRNPKIARDAVKAHGDSLFDTASGPIQAELINLIQRLDVPLDNKTFFDWVSDTKRPQSVRSAALRLLAARKFENLSVAIQTALDDQSPKLRADARDVLSKFDANRALKLLSATLDNSNSAVVERQQAFASLTAIKNKQAETVLQQWTSKLVAGKVPHELQLDLIEAATNSASAAIKKNLQSFQTNQQSGSDPLAQYRVSLAGGDAERGRQLFVNHRTAQCIRCHKINSTGGTAGPDLSKVSKKNNREYLLQSLIDPNAKIAPGFGSVALVLTSGKIVAGTLKSEKDGKLVVATSDNKLVTVNAKDVVDRSAAKSAMPTVRKALTPRELRDVVEYLSTLK